MEPMVLLVNLLFPLQSKHPLLFFVLCPIWILIIGIVLFRRGLHGRPAGSTPLCKKCHYNLTGITSEKCPECGSDLTIPKARTTGPFERQKGLLLIASCLLIAGAHLGYQWYTQFNVYWWLPYSAVFKLAEWDVPSAWRNLHHRRDFEILTRAEFDQVTETALEKQEESYKHPGKMNDTWDSWLAIARWYHFLKPEQRTRYLNRIFKTQMYLRKNTRVGDPLPITLHALSNSTEEVFGMWNTSVAIEIDNKEILVFQDTQEHSPGSLWTGKTIIADTDSLSPGPHTCTATIDVSFYGNYKTDYQMQQIVSQTFTLLDEDAPDPVHWIDDKNLTNEISRKLKPASIDISNSMYWPDSAGTLTIQFEEQPTLPTTENPVAFEYCILQNEQTIFQFTWPVDTWSSGDPTTLILPLQVIPPNGNVDVLIRGSKESARNTIDIYNAWNGEIRFNNIPLSYSIAPEAENP